MTNKKVSPVKKYEPVKFPVQDTVLKTPATCMPTNLKEEKEKFLRSGRTPKFHLKDRSKVEELASKAKNHIRFDLFGEAQFILEKIRDTYGNGEFYLEHAFGPRIEKEDATPVLLNYITENNLPESIRIHWCDNLACSAKMVWTGPVVNSNRPELRKYSLWLNGSDENPYMRETGIKCLMDHEIGTHFYRNFNDGLQPWYADRERFGLRKLGTFEGQCTEEGLAAINTVLRGRVRYLWSAALTYYIACKSAEMTFKELFDHLGNYTSNPDYRWKQAMRVKRGLDDPNELGGFGNDQCYFEGAVNILRKMDDLDFHLLMTGKICYDELDRIKRVARRDVVKFPDFIRNEAAYKKTLRKILVLNGLNGFHVQRNPPAVYLKHLEEKKLRKSSQKPKKVRSTAKLTMLSKNISKKGKNRKYFKEETNVIKEEEEIVKSFQCSQRFSNMHLRCKNLTSPEEILITESKELKNVKRLTTSLTDIDKNLENHILKLQNIVKNHQWSSSDELCTTKEDNKTTQGAGDTLTLPLIDESKPQAKCTADKATDKNENCSRAMLCLSSTSNTCESVCSDSALDYINEEKPKTISQLTETHQDNLSIRDESFEIIDVAKTPFLKSQVLDHRKSTIKRKLKPSRQCLYTPVADVSEYTDIMSLHPSIAHSGIAKNKGSNDRTGVKHRSLTLKNKKLQRKDEIVSPNSPDLVILSRQDNAERQTYLHNHTAVIEQTPSNQYAEDLLQLHISKNKRISSSNKHRAVTPMSTGSERILNFHFLNVSHNPKTKSDIPKPVTLPSNALCSFSKSHKPLKFVSSSANSSL